MSAIAFRKFLGIILTLVVTTPLLAQSFKPERWYRIRTPHFDIIFRGNIRREAQRVANTLQHLYEPVSQSLGVNPPKIALVLRNQQVVFNAYVALSPRRMEFYTCPTQDYNFIGTNDWLTLLTVHELRHVVQYAKLHQNFNQRAHQIGGDFFLANMINFNVPLWFMEGDAVDIETALTQSGRGRIPRFSLLYKANLLERKNFSYPKQVLGSFKDSIPDHYKMGYYLTTYLRRQYGPHVCADILALTTRPRLFYSTIEKRTGKSLRQIYEAANQEIRSLWTNQLKGLKLTQATRLNTRNCTTYTNYTHPQLNREGHIIALKSGIGTVPQFVTLDSQQKERTLFTPGSIDLDVGFSVAQNQIVWVEKIPDPRWADRSYGVIQHYDNQAKRLKTLTHKSRYGSAALSPDANQIVAFESDEGYNHRLVILDARNGQVLQRLSNPDNHFYLTPKWSEDGRQIIVVKHVQQQATITCINVSTGETQDLLPYTTEHIGCPVMTGKYVFYSGIHSGIDNIYAIDLATNQRYQVTSRKYGAYNPTISADNCWIIFNDFTKDGMDVVKMPFNPNQWIPLAQVEDRSVHYYAPLVQQEGYSNVLAQVPQYTYPIEDYRPEQHWFNVHSWLTINALKWNTNTQKSPLKALRQIDLTILQAKDVLDTTELTVNYLHDFQEKSGAAYAKVTYKAFYPNISLSSTLGMLASKHPFRILSVTDFSLEFPWNFVQGQYTHNMKASTTGTLYKTDIHNGYAQSYHVQFKRFSKKSLRDIYYPWQQELCVNYWHTPYQAKGPHPLWRAVAQFYFPGLVKHHALHVNASYQHTTAGEWRKIGPSTIPRDDPDTMLYYHCAMQVHYDLPICYPDWTVGYLAYVKRLRCKVAQEHCFHLYPPDQAQNNYKHKNSTVIELLADIHPLTFLNIPLCSISVGYYYDWTQQRGCVCYSARLTSGS